MPGLYALRSTSSSAKPPRPLPLLVPSHHNQQNFSSVAGVARPLPAFHAPPFLPPTCAQPINPPPPTHSSSNDPALARIHASSSSLNYSSSGSPHEPSSICLAAMVHDFLEDEARVGSCGRARCNCLNGTCDSHDTSCIANEADEPSIPAEQLCEILEGVTSCTSSAELLLLAAAAKAVDAEIEELSSNADGKQKSLNAVMGCLRRPVMKRLRKDGYNAAICKSKWSHGDGFPAGDYEFIDVIMDGKNGKPDRFIVEIEFQAQFEIARASDQYCDLLKVLPRVFVGRTERLKQILKIMCSAAKRSLKKEGLHLPPWRKQRYMQAKWFSSYRRTTNEESQKPRIKTDEALGTVASRALRFCMEFTKEMDLFYFRSQCQGQGDLMVAKRDESICPKASEFVVGKATKRGFLDDQLSEAYIEPRRNNANNTFAVVCTDWQPPALNQKNVRNRSDGVSGLAKALKEAGLSPHPEASLLQKTLTVAS